MKYNKKEWLCFFVISLILVILIPIVPVKCVESNTVEISCNKNTIFNKTTTIAYLENSYDVNYFNTSSEIFVNLTFNDDPSFSLTIYIRSIQEGSLGYILYEQSIQGRLIDSPKLGITKNIDDQRTDEKNKVHDICSFLGLTVNEQTWKDNTFFSQLDLWFAVSMLLESVFIGFLICVLIIIITYHLKQKKK